MRRTPKAICALLAEQSASGDSVANFCAERDLKMGTFYAWKKKYRGEAGAEQVGFCKIVPKQEKEGATLQLPSGLRLQISGLPLPELAELILTLDRAYA